MSSSTESIGAWMPKRNRSADVCLGAAREILNMPGGPSRSAVETAKTLLVLYLEQTAKE